MQYYQMLDIGYLKKGIPESGNKEDNPVFFPTYTF